MRPAKVSKTLSGIAGQAKVRLYELKHLRRHDAEGWTAAHDGSVRNGADALDDALGDGQLPLRIDVTVIAEVAYRYADEFRVEVANRALYLAQIILTGEHQID